VQSLLAGRPLAEKIAWFEAHARLSLIPTRFANRLGILVDAEKMGMIPEVAPLVVRLRREIDFRISESLIDDILDAAGEATRS
jgi:predicted nucleic acid-binding protein